MLFLEEVATGAYRLEPFAADDVRRAAEVIEQYRGLLGLADASLVVLADRGGTTRLLTLDERHFRTVRPFAGGSFDLLPGNRIGS